MDLKDPLGELWPADVSDNVKRLKKFLEENKPPYFATVGDYVTLNILDAGIHPEIAVVDHRIMRQDVDPIEFNCEHLSVSNPPGTITAESQRALYGALEHDSGFRLVADGEEDLLVLPLMAYLPEGSVIVYGQPREGMVVITLTEKNKTWARDFMASMQEAQDQ
jgi:uncharacterized protein (UPF0218 family)